MSPPIEPDVSISIAMLRPQFGGSGGLSRMSAQALPRESWAVPVPAFGNWFVVLFATAPVNSWLYGCGLELFAFVPVSSVSAIENPAGAVRSRIQ